MNGERAPADMADVARPRAPDLRGAFNDAADRNALPPLRRPRVYTVDDLIEAVKAEDARRVQSLITGGVDVNAKDANGDTALVVAAREGKTAVIKTLMDGKADPDIGDRRGTLPVTHAVQKGHVETLDAMLANGASPNAKTPADFRPLESVIRRMDTQNRGRETFDMLIKHGADVHQVADDLTTLVMIAASADNDYALGVLLDKKASVGGVSIHGQSALTVAARNYSVKTARMLIAAGADVTHVTPEGRIASQEAAHAGFPDLAKILADAETKYVEKMLKDGTGHETVAPKMAKFKKRDGQKP